MSTKTAVLISGQMRSAAYCFPSIERYLLRRLDDFDVYAHIADDADADSISLFGDAVVERVKQPLLPEFNYWMRTGRQVFGVQQVLRMLWSIEESNRLRKESGIAYDWVVRLRPDTEFLCDLEPLPELDPNGVYIPTFCNWWGYNDRFAIMGAKWADAYHDKYSKLDDYIRGGGIFHPETFLKACLDASGAPVGRTQVLFDTVRTDTTVRVVPEWHAECGDIVPSWKL